MLEPFPDKPKRMRHATYDRLRKQADALEEAYLATISARLSRIDPMINLAADRLHPGKPVGPEIEHKPVDEPEPIKAGSNDGAIWPDR